MKKFLSELFVIEELRIRLFATESQAIARKVQDIAITQKANLEISIIEPCFWKSSAEIDEQKLSIWKKSMDEDE